MQKLKKWSKKLLSATLLTALISSSFTYAAENKTAPEALKEGVVKQYTESYNSKITITAYIEKDVNALLANKKSRLTEELARQELEAYYSLSSADGQNAINMINGSKLVIDGTINLKDKYTDMVITTDYDMNGIRASIDFPIYIGFKDEFVGYFDPKAGKAFGMLPPFLQDKLIKFTLNDIPDLTPKHKEQLRPNGPFVSKFIDIVMESVLDFRGTEISDTELSDIAKQAGAVRVIKMLPNIEYSTKQSTLYSFKILELIASEFSLPTRKLAKLKLDALNNNPQGLEFIDSLTNLYGLDDKNRIVYTETTLVAKGAKHKGVLKITITNSNFGDPIRKFDITQKPSITVTELQHLTKNTH